jgi:hypothetical protein
MYNLLFKTDFLVVALIKKSNFFLNNLSTDIYDINKKKYFFLFACFLKNNKESYSYYTHSLSVILLDNIFVFFKQASLENSLFWS